MERRSVIIKKDPTGTSVLLPKSEDVFGEDVGEEFEDDVDFILTVDTKSLELPFSEKIPLFVWTDVHTNMFEYEVYPDGTIRMLAYDDEMLEEDCSAADFKDFFAPEDDEEIKEEAMGLRGVNVSLTLGETLGEKDPATNSDLVRSEIPISVGYPVWVEHEPIFGTGDGTKDAKVGDDTFIAQVYEGMFFGYFYYYYNPQTRRVKAFHQQA